MVDKSYMLSEPPGPSALKVKWDQQAIPLLIDAAGAVEVQLEKVSATVRRLPLTCLLVAAGVGLLAARVRA